MRMSSLFCTKLAPSSSLYSAKRQKELDSREHLASDVTGAGLAQSAICGAGMVAKNPALHFMAGLAQLACGLHGPRFPILGNL